MAEQVIDDSGKMMPPGLWAVRNKVGASLGLPNLSTYLIMNMGFVGVTLAGPRLKIRVRPIRVLRRVSRWLTLLMEAIRSSAAATLIQRVCADELQVPWSQGPGCSSLVTWE